jgi:hypothetical protein
MSLFILFIGLMAFSLDSPNFLLLLIMIICYSGFDDLIDRAKKLAVKPPKPRRRHRASRAATYRSRKAPSSMG